MKTRLKSSKFMTAARAIELVVVIAFLGLVQPAWGEDTPLSTVAKRCEKDIGTFCSNVKPMEGRILACLHTNDDKISTECGVALNDASLQFERALGQWGQVVSACEADFEQHCARSKTGKGRLLRCMTVKVLRKEGVSKGCQMALHDAGLI